MKSASRLGLLLLISRPVGGGRGGGGSPKGRGQLGVSSCPPHEVQARRLLEELRVHGKVGAKTLPLQ